MCYYRPIFNIRRTLVRNKIVDHSDVVGASFVDAARSNYIVILDWLQWIGQKQLQDEHEDIVGAALTGDAPTTSELSTIWLATEMRLISKVLR